VEHRESRAASSSRPPRGWAIAALLALCAGGSVLVFWAAERQAGRVYEVMFVQGTALQARLVAEVRQTYSSEVAARAARHGMQVRHDYQDHASALPLPATLTMELGRRYSETNPGTGIRLYSDFPFPWRQEGGPRDAFERDALAALRARPEEPFYRFETYEGRPSLRYAVADRMQSSCVECHNAHPDSPRRDWREGDVRGVLEVIRPASKEMVEAKAGMHSLLGVGVGIGAMGIGGLVLLFLRLRRSWAALLQSERRYTDLFQQARQTLSRLETTNLALVAAEQSAQRAREESQQKVAELEKFQRLAVGRELRMIELKRQVNELCGQVGEPEPFDLACFRDASAGDACEAEPAGTRGDVKP
jgi:hypothetical protein